MRRLLIVSLLTTSVQDFATGQSCKPDVSRRDPITKDQADIWRQTLWSTSFLGSMVNTSESEVVALIGRVGSLNTLSLVVQKREESATNAAFEQAWRGAQGQPFYLGFKEAEPLSFLVTSVENAAEIKQGLFDAKGVTTVVITAAIADRDLAAMRNALTTQQVDAVRLLLADNAPITRSVSAGNASKLRAKFACFFETLDQRGVDLLADNETPSSSPTSETASAVGKYLRRYKESDYLQLTPEGRVHLRQDGKEYTGRYRLQRNDLVLEINRQKIGGNRVVGDTIVDVEGELWIRRAESPPLDNKTLTIDQIIEMASAKVSDDIIILTIQKGGTKFDLTPELVIRLKKGGVSDSVIKVMATAHK